MKFTIKLLILLCIPLAMSSCVSKKKYLDLQNQFEVANKDLGKCGESLSDYMNKLAACNQERNTLKSNLSIREEQVADLKYLIEDMKKQRDMQAGQVTELTNLSQSASQNINQTLSQLEGKDKYIRFLQAAKTRADSINLALAINLKGVLQKGIEEEDVEVKVDKTVVFINLSDKMLYQSGSAEITPRANEVLGKIAKIIESRPNLEVMVEGYTDNVPISSECFKDNWDLSVKRSTSVVRALQNKFNIDPNRLIAAGRGEYNTLASNDTPEGRSTNRRTRIIIMPKLNEFYDLLNPELAPE
jgi:chemotaxis protein MotB